MCRKTDFLNPYRKKLAFILRLQKCIFRRPFYLQYAGLLFDFQAIAFFPRSEKYPSRTMAMSIQIDQNPDRNNRLLLQTMFLPDGMPHASTGPAMPANTCHWVEVTASWFLNSPVKYSGNPVA
jgi:hypothetical protein